MTKKTPLWAVCSTGQNEETRISRLSSSLRDPVTVLVAPLGLYIECRIPQHHAVDLELPGEGFLAEGVEVITAYLRGYVEISDYVIIFLTNGLIFFLQS